MKKSISLIAAALIIAVSFTSCSKKSAKMKNETDSLSYALGINLGNMFKENAAQIPGGKNKVDSVIAGFKAGLGESEQSYILGLSYASNISNQFKQMTEGQKVNKDLVLKAFIAALKGDSATAMNNEAANMYLRSYVPKSKKVENTKAKVANEQFLVANKAKAGVVTTASGLQYEVVAMGKGPKPTINDKVKVKYRGTTIDGKEFDKNEQGVSFPLNGVIKGWSEGIQLMPVGSKFKLYIPYQLAYGETGNQAIKPFSTLIFEVELVAIEKGDAASAQADQAAQMQAAQAAAAQAQAAQAR
ncbi:FKBP-type peptidyl-prolyl cis-trans isomerase [Parabacteroides sp. FAFU027]|uniref:FKBP-type peptidyl-prolyl cis-trans isomerase n=1 Tax=Parabacteroides sp. FAFU027 TaxID=2922715 RepID=UPI001FAE956B|nr:FKBP-type peptidyl-prolyl cis-trans isomerase [Parabacteroides sp. FAFU027]